jgi:hypothetical protein
MPEINNYQSFITFILPILLGIVTTIFIFFGKSLISDTIIPLWVEKKNRSNHLIAGKWKAVTNPTYDTERSYAETIHLRQIGEDVIGDIFYKELARDSNQTAIDLKEKHFELKGTFADLVLSATYYNTERRSRGRGTFCLFSVDDQTLKGKFSWYEPHSGNIEAGEYHWKRLT